MRLCVVVVVVFVVMHSIKLEKVPLSLLVLLNFAFKTSHNKFSIVYKSIERIYLHSHTAALKKKKRCTLSFVVSWRWHCSISGSLMCRCLESCCHVIVIVIEILLLKFDFKIKPLLAHNDGVLVCCCISCSLFYSLLHLLACIFVLAAFWPFANIRMLIVWTTRKCNNVVIYTVHFC